MKTSRVFFAEHFGGDGIAHRGFDFLRRGPDVAKVDGLAGFVVAERLVDDVDVHAAGERVGDDERRRSEIIGAAQSGLMRPSKLRLPLRTETATRLLSLMALPIGSGSGPLLPMQVVQP